MNGITKPTQFELHYEYYENYFLLYPVNGDDEESTESDRLAEELLQGICTFAREYESVNNQRDQGIEEGQVQHPVVGEDVVGHYTWKQTCSRSFAAGESCLVRNLSFFIKNYYYQLYLLPSLYHIVLFLVFCINNDLQSSPLANSRTSQRNIRITHKLLK
jgi:hypothetical protein